MELLHDINVLWTRDLAVGSATMDARNRDMFARLSVIGGGGASTALAIPAATAAPAALADSLLQALAQLEVLLDEEERELEAAGYPELVFHRQLHQRARARLAYARTQLSKAADASAAVALSRDTCAGLAVWLMRHVQDADKLFLPYIDARVHDC